MAPADPIGADVEGEGGELAAMEADVVQGAVVKRTQLRDGATSRHPLGEAGEYPSSAAPDGPFPWRRSAWQTGW